MRAVLLLFASSLVLAVPVAAAAAEPPSAAAPQAVKPREVAGRIAALVEEHYYDPVRAKTLADELRAAAARGAFDRQSDPRDLAVALTDALKPRDAHFNVTWSPPGAAQAAGPRSSDAEMRAAWSLQERRTNYGFRGVGMLPGAIGYIDMSGFADFDGRNEPDAPARRAADAAMQLVSGADAVIIDLRDNGGGSPAMVGYLASYFLPKGAEVYNIFKSRGPDESEAPQVEVAGPRRLEAPLYILTSGRTASAAEAFAYTLQAARRAVVVGERSAGAANPGGSGPAGDGFSVFISSGHPVNPVTGTNWEGSGVKPDVEAAPADALRKAQTLALLELAKAPPKGEAAVENAWTLEALQAEAAGQPAPGELEAYVGDYDNRVVAVVGGRLSLRQGRRPAVTLVRVSPDLFAAANAPSRRYRFERAGGRVTAVITLSPDGGEARLARRSPG
jgi:hypothetical protein